MERETALQKEVNLFAALCATRLADVLTEIESKTDRSAESNNSAFIRTVGASLLRHGNDTERFMPKLEHIEGHLHNGELVNVTVNMYSKTLDRRVKITAEVDV